MDTENLLRELFRRVILERDPLNGTWLEANQASTEFLRETRDLVNSSSRQSENIDEECCGCLVISQAWSPYILTDNDEPISLALTPTWCFDLNKLETCSLDTAWVRSIELVMYALLCGIVSPTILAMPLCEVDFPDDEACVVILRNGRAIHFRSQAAEGLMVGASCVVGCALMPLTCLTPLGLGCLNGTRAGMRKSNDILHRIQAKLACSDPAVEEALKPLPATSQVREELSKAILTWDPHSEAIKVSRPSRGFLKLALVQNMPRLRVNADVIVLALARDQGELTSDFHVHKNLAIVPEPGADNEPCEVDLPDGLYVGGNAVVARVKVRSFGKNISIKGDCILRVANSDPFRLPDDFEVLGQLNCASCKTLEGLPSGMTTALDLILSDCSALQELPATLEVVEGNLVLMRCESLQRLPAGLTVKGDLVLNGCTALEELPENLTVMGDILATDCTALRRVPDSVSCLGSEMNFLRCASLFSLPLEPLREPRSSMLMVNIAETSIVGEALEALRSIDNSDVRFFGSWRPDVADSDARELQLSTLYDVAREFGVQAVDLERHIDRAYVYGVLKFLSMLLSSSEFQHEEMRDDLKERVKEILRVVIEDEVSREEIVVRMIDATDACADKPIWALGQMQVVAAIAHARGDRHKLRKLGLSIMRLNIVHKHVERVINARGRAVDDVCVYLRFEIALREPLDLPVSSKVMLYSNHVDVSESDIARAKREALGISDAAFEQWLAEWPEWQRQERLERVVPYLELPRADAKTFSDARPEEAVNLLGDAVLDPVIILPDKSNVWSYNDFCAHWVRTGCDFTNAKTDFEAVQRLQDTEPATNESPRRASLARRRLSSRGSDASRASRRRRSSRLSDKFDEDTVASTLLRAISNFIPNVPRNNTSIGWAAPIPEESFSRGEELDAEEGPGDDVQDDDREHHKA